MFVISYQGWLGHMKGGMLLLHQDASQLTTFPRQPLFQQNSHVTVKLYSFHFSLTAAGKRLRYSFTLGWLMMHLHVTC